jgi:hypothetical protein
MSVGLDLSASLFEIGERSMSNEQKRGFFTFRFYIRGIRTYIKED